MLGKMGSACCVAARDRTIVNRSSDEALQSTVRYSPSWSFRWDNRGRVAGEEASLNSFSDGGSRNDGLEVKSQTLGTAYASEERSPFDSFHKLTWQNSRRYSGTLAFPQSDPTVSRHSSEVKESNEAPAVSDPSLIKMSPLMHSGSSLLTSPLSSQDHLLTASSTPSRCSRRYPGRNLLRQISDSRIPVMKSPRISVSEEASSFVLPGWSNESNRGSHGEASDRWLFPTFPEPMANSLRERWSFDSEFLSLSREKLNGCVGRFSCSPSIDVQTCGACSKLLSERSSWKANELAVVAVLICGHVFHADCLENVTAEINKYDPVCPVCTLGEKHTSKFSGEALNAEIELMAGLNKRSRRRVVDGNISGEFVAFDRRKNTRREAHNNKVNSNSSTNFSFGKSFLSRHFSFGAKGSRPFSENHTARRKGFFWARSTRD